MVHPQCTRSLPTIAPTKAPTSPMPTPPPTEVGCHSCQLELLTFNQTLSCDVLLSCYPQNFQCAIVNTGPTYKPFTALACDANCTRLAAAQQNLLLTSSDSGSSYDDRGWPPYAEDSSQPLWPTFNATTNVAAMCSSKDGKYLLAATNGPEEPLYPGSGLYNYGHLFSSQDYGVTWKSLGTVGNYGAYSSCAVSDGKQSSWYARSCGETRD